MPNLKDEAQSYPVEVLFGGSFDPVHNGHEAMVRGALNALAPASARVIPCKTPPHKSQLHASEEARLAMLQLAFGDIEGLSIDRRELDSGETSYTVNSVAAIRRELGDKMSLCFLIGEDSWRHFSSWCQWEKILEFVNLLVVARPHDETVIRGSRLAPELQQYLDEHKVPLSEIKTHKCGKIAELSLPANDAASSDIRCRLTGTLDKGGVNPSDLNSWVPTKVANYIVEHKLYT